MSTDPGGEKPGYWAVLPAAIRYDPELPASAKLLYAEISSLTDQRGYCYATNAYFEKLYELSERTVIRLIRALEAAGYLRIEDNNGGKDQRRLYAGVNPLQLPPDKNVSTPCQKCQGGPDKNVTPIEINKDIKKDIKNPPKAPRGGRRVKSVPDWEPELFERFWAAFPQAGHKDRPLAVREWDKLKPDISLMHRMGRALDLQKASAQWQRGIGIPYAGRWLSHRRWEDEADPVQACPIQQADGCVRSPEVEAW